MLGHCRVCNSPCREFGRMAVLGKFEGVYEICQNCGYLQARDPFWLQESYQNAITKSDIGTVSRCMVNSVYTRLIAGLYLRSKGPFLDYGAGYGMFVRFMRDHGYDFWYYDSYCQNLFAEDFAVQADERRSFELLTSFEVFEHMVDPMRDLDEMLRFSKRVIFTTELLPEPMPSMGQWWYHGPDHGQHVGFFSIRTLEWVAKKHSLCFATNGKNFHYLGKAAINGRVFRFLTHARAESLLRLCRRPSLLMTDLDIRRAKSFARVGYNAKPPSVAGN